MKDNREALGREKIGSLVLVSSPSFGSCERALQRDGQDLRWPRGGR